MENHPRMFCAPPPPTSEYPQDHQKGGRYSGQQQQQQPNTPPSQIPAYSDYYKPPPLNSAYSMQTAT